jgi:hypothetical protein
MQLGWECREGLSETQIDGGIDLIEKSPAVLSARPVRVAAVPTCVAATHRATEALLIGGQQRPMLLRVRAPSRCRTFCRCLAGSAVRAAANRRSSSLWIKLGSSSSRMISAHTTWSRRSCEPGGCYRTPGRQGAATRRNPDIGNSEFYERSTRSMYATSHSRISGRHQALHDAGFDRPTWRQGLVLLGKPVPALARGDASSLGRRSRQNLFEVYRKWQ